MPLYTTTIQLPVRTPFDLEKSITFLAQFGPLRDDTYIRDGVVTRALLIDGQIAVYRIVAGEKDVAVTLWSDRPLPERIVAEVARRISFFLSLEDDLGPFYAIGERDAPFRPVLDELRGYHHVKFPSPFEVAVWAILSQRNTQTSARTMRSALIERYGARLEVEGRVYRAFPEPWVVAQAAPGEVTAVVRHAQKGPAVGAVAEAFSQVDDRWLQAASYAEVERWLRGIYGIGPWGAGFIMLRGLGKMERLPGGERKLLAAIGQVYGCGGPVSEGEAERIAAPYGAYKGYWAHYLRVAT